MNARERKKLKQQMRELAEECPTCKATNNSYIRIYKRILEEMGAIETKLNQERLANAQLRATLRHLTR